MIKGVRIKEGGGRQVHTEQQRTEGNLKASWRNKERSQDGGLVEGERRQIVQLTGGSEGENIGQE